MCIRDRCETINGSWGFNLKDRKHKSNKELIQYLIKAAGYGSNLLLNVGPMPNGEIQEKHIKSLEKIGKWIAENGETIYKTRKGPIDPTDEFVSTRKGNKIYLHILDFNKSQLIIEGLSEKIKKVSYYNTNFKVDYTFKKSTLIINLDKDQLREIDTIIELTVKS